MAENATYREIVTQPAAWKQAIDVSSQMASELQALWNTGTFEQVILTGCGSTYYLSVAAAALLQSLTGISARGVPAGELGLYPSNAYTSGQTLLVAVSRSAETSETIRAVQAFQEEKRGPVIVVTNYADRPLAALGDLVLAIPAGQEESIAQTRSFASMYVATTAMATIVARRTDLLEAMHSLPDTGQALIEREEAVAQRMGSNLDLDRFYFLGSGPRYGLACEVNLKMKEMTLTHSEPFHMLEFRHGPKAMVGDSAAVIGLLSAENREHESAVLTEMGQLGGQTLTLAETEADVAFASGLPEPVRNVLYLPVLQLMAYHRAIAKGLDPDKPTNLDAVVKLTW
jgi:glucosamine--fructose-6-phosphate aminotransferase (isomerizing)